jgi:hypothetical protein
MQMPHADPITSAYRVDSGAVAEAILRRLLAGRG